MLLIRTRQPKKDNGASPDCHQGLPAENVQKAWIAVVECGRF